MFKKIFLSILMSLVIFMSVAPSFAPVSAQATPTWYNQDFKSWYSKVYDSSNPSDIFGERYTAAQVEWVVYGIWAFIFNIVVPQGITECVFKDSVNINTCADQISNILSKNIDSTGIASRPKDQNIWSLVFATNRPLSGIAYVRSKIVNFKLIPTAHAQVGVGFGALEPVRDLWQGFRNISYGLFVLVTIVFAFMIMFRVKINPQTVISVQSAIPKIIISLILVTFSYAIAGLLIDLMYVVIGIVSIIGSSLGPLGLSTTSIFNFLTLGQPFNVNYQAGIFVLLGIYLMLLFVALVVLIFVGGGIAGVALSTPILIVLSILFILVAIIVAIWITFKTIWGLLKAFVNVLLLTIFAPLQITAGIFIPSLGFGSWVKSYVITLSTFIVTGVLILFSYIFLISGVNTGIGSSSTLGQVILRVIAGDNGNAIAGILGTGNVVAAWPPLIGSSNQSFVGLLLVVASFVLFTMIPKANEFIQAFLSGKPFAYGSAIGEAIGPVKAGIGVVSGYQENILKAKGSSATRGDQILSAILQRLAH